MQCRRSSHHCQGYIACEFFNDFDQYTRISTESNVFALSRDRWHTQTENECANSIDSTALYVLVHSFD